jgi:4-amino-4-deoxy-L-arabinose transferase-like glycosyltransferase
LIQLPASDYSDAVANENPESDASKPNLRIEITLVSVVIAIFLVVSIFSMRQKNATSDEVPHIGAAYSYVTQGDFRLNPEHPPLVKELAGLSLLRLHPKADFTDETWSGHKQISFGSKFLFEWNDADQLVYWARMAVVCLGILLGLGIFFCARELYGWQAGYLALVVFLFNPDILAHSQLVTTDLAVACFLFLSVYTFYRTLRQVTLYNVVLFSACVGLTLVTKFSGILIFPILLLVGIAFASSKSAVSTIDAKRPGAPPRLLPTFRQKLYLVAVLLAFGFVVSLGIIWAAYGFQYPISQDPTISTSIDWQHYWTKRGASISFMHMAHNLRLFPEAYTYGFLHALESMEIRYAYLLGDYSDKGWWYYFLITFLVKTPIPLLALILLGFLQIKRFGRGFAVEVMLLLPVGIYWLTAIFNNINIGHRHLLPVYPFLIVFAAKVGRAFQKPVAKRLAILSILLLTWNLTETLIIYPHFLAYFNEIAGGPDNGRRWLTDSNIDWGQDLKGLAAYRQQHPEEPFYLSYFGAAPPEYYGIRAGYLLGFNPQVLKKLDANEVTSYDQIPSGAIVAISATNLSGVHLRHFDFPGTVEFLQKLRAMQPIANIGHSILIYRMP